MNEPLLEPSATNPNSCCAQQSNNPTTMPITAPIAEIIRPSKRKIRTICLSDAPKYQHRERADDVEASHHQDERQEDVSDELLDLHNLKRVILLLKTVLHHELRTTQPTDLLLHSIEIAAWFQAQFQRREHTLLVEYPAGKADTRKDIVLIVFRLQANKDHPPRRHPQDW